MPKIFQLRTAADGIRPERAMLSASGKATAAVRRGEHGQDAGAHSSGREATPVGVA